MVAELQYSHEVNALEKRFDSWTDTDHLPPASRTAVSRLPSARDVAKSLPPEVAQFTVCYPPYITLILAYSYIFAM